MKFKTVSRPASYLTVGFKGKPESCGLVGLRLDRRKLSFGQNDGWFLLSWSSGAREEGGGYWHHVADTNPSGEISTSFWMCTFLFIK